MFAFILKNEYKLNKVQVKASLHDLQSRDLVSEDLLGLVEVGQHDLRLSVVDDFQLLQVSVVPLPQVLLMGSAANTSPLLLCAMMGPHVPSVLLWGLTAPTFD